MGSSLMTMPAQKIDHTRINLREQFAKWLFNQTMASGNIPNGRIIGVARCGNEIIRLKNDGNPVIESEVRSWVSYARLYFERNFNCTLWNVRGRGWRGSTKIETARYYGKSVRKTIAWADRTRQLQTIVERKYIPFAIKEVVGKAEGGIHNLSGLKQIFIEKMKEFEASEKKQLENIK